MKNMSKRAAEILKDDMEARGPVKLADVEAAQKEIIVIAQRLAEEGTISIGRQGGRRICLTRRKHHRDRRVPVDCARYGSAGSQPPNGDRGRARRFARAEAHKEAFEQGLRRRPRGRPCRSTRPGRAPVGHASTISTKPFEELDAEVERELLTLAMALARQIVRRELKSRSNANHRHHS